MNGLRSLLCTVDVHVDKAAILMRMLFIKDLRKLQTSIDSAIVEVQVSSNFSCFSAEIDLLCGLDVMRLTD